MLLFEYTYDTQQLNGILLSSSVYPENVRETM